VSRPGSAEGRVALNRDKILKAVERYLRQGKVEGAIEQLLKLVRESPRDMNTINRVGDLYARLGRTDEAVAQYRRIADFYNKEGFLLKAIAIYKKVSKLDPSNPEPYQSLARLYSQQGLTMEARAQFQIVADHHLRAGDNDAALVVYQELVQLDPGDLKVNLAIAEILERLDRAEEAVESYRAVGRSLDRQGRCKESRKVYEAALRLAPRDNSLVRCLVFALRRESATGEALQFLVGLLEGRPEDLELIGLVGDAHLDDGNIDQARELYGRREHRSGQGAL